MSYTVDAGGSTPGGKPIRVTQTAVGLAELTPEGVLALALLWDSGAESTLVLSSCQ